jgi:hypothetical protein
MNSNKADCQTRPLCERIEPRDAVQGFDLNGHSRKEAAQCPSRAPMLTFPDMLFS